jgi:hypothetical protein
MPRAGSPEILSFDIRDLDIDRALYHLRNTDKDLYNQMRRDFRTAVKPIAKELQGNIPRGGSPLSGMSRSPRKARTMKSADQRSPYVWKLPATKIDIGSRRSGRRGTKSVARIQFLDKRPFSAFSILETARQSSTPRGQNMIAGITSKFPNNGKGRWVIEQFYDRRQEMVRIGRRVVAKYSRSITKKIASGKVSI